MGTNGRGGKKGQAASGINAGSFAARMMAKMGYKEGDGLGKEGQGRSGVIEVTLRPQGVGLGAVKEKSKQEIEEEKRQARLKGEKYEDSDEERKKRRKKPKSGLESGSGSGMSTPRRAAKPKFRTLEEVQKAAPGLQIPEAFAPILDMTAPGQRLLTTTSGLLTPTAGGFETAEQAESKKLARRAQNDLSAYVEEWKNLEERKAYVEMTIVQQQQELDEEQLEYDRMKSFADTVQSISQAVRDLQWDPVIEALIQADNLAEPGSSKASEELSNIAVAAVHPFLRQAVEGWQPLEDPKLTGMAPQLSKIRHILGASTSDGISITSQHYLKNDGSHRIHSKSTTHGTSMILLHCKHCLRFGMDYYRHLFALKFSTKQLLGSLTTQSPLGIQRRDELMSCRICGFSHGFNICLRTMWTRRAQLVLLAISSGSFAISSTLGTSERELYLDLSNGGSCYVQPPRTITGHH